MCDTGGAEIINITWEDGDLDDNAIISLARDTDDVEQPWATGEHSWLAGDALRIFEDDSANYYPWDTTDVPAGTYVIWAMIHDPNHAARFSRAAGRVTIGGQIGDFCGADFGPPDGYVDVWDLMQLADHWHTRTGEGNWDGKFDLAGPDFGDPDGYVDVWDLMVFADNWHEGQKP